MARTVAPIDALLKDRHLLKHPFYRAWSAGEIPIETLRSYARQYYQFEANFPRYVAAAYSKLARPEDRRQLLDNLVDEEGRDPTHPALWLDFARSIGASRRSVETATPLGATRRLLACYDRFAARGPAPALASLYAYESIFPEVAAEKSRGLREQYGITDPKAHEFFRVHTTADVEHAGAERRILSSAMDLSPAARREALFAARTTIDAWWSFLDAFPVA